MGGDTRSRRRERSSSSETDKKKLKKSRRYKKRTYSSEEISSGSEDDFKRVSPEKKKSKSKSKKKLRESPSPEKRKKRRRSSSSLSSSPERKSSKKKKASKYDSEEESPIKKKKKKHRESRSRSKSPIKTKSTGGKVKEKYKERKEEKSKKKYDSESGEEDDRQIKEKVKHKDKGKEDGAAKGTGNRDREKNGEHRKDKEKGEEHHKERHKDQDVDTSSDKEEKVIHREPKEEKTESKEKKATKEKETKSKDRDKREKTGEYKEIDKQKERDKDRERERIKDKEREKERDRERGKERDRERGHKEEERETKEKVRSRDQREDKGRDRDRDRERNRDRDRDQDKERKAPGKDERHRSRKHDRHDDKETSENKSGKDKSEGAVALDNIEDAMRRRKERVEAWRLARQHKDGEETQEEKVAGKKWSLEDDDDDDEEDDSVKKNDEKDEEDEVDPLDAYMKEVQKQVKKFNAFGQTAKEKGKTTTIVTTVVKKAESDMGEKKPEVIEQNQDLMEYSSEEGEKEDILEGNAFAAMKQKKKKELLAADHSKIYYRPFRKNFYVEVPDLAKMTDEEVDKYRLELGSIRVVGRDIPKPIKTWAQSGVNNKILEVLKKCNYEKPTPVQAQGIPSIMSGRDVIGIAKTGSGKTLAFLLPMFRHVLDQPPLDENDGPIAIIMTPTRELALQIHKETKRFCKPLGLQAVCIYGGSGISEQIAELKRGAEIIVCTPGRMIDMLTANSGRVTNCRRCTYLVLDEADRMFDMGFEPQVMKIIANIRDDRQTVLFSATFPRQLEGLARKLLKSPIEIEVGGRSIVCSDISQHVVVIDEDNKFLKLLELLGMYQDQGSILVFVEKQDSADVLFKDLLKRGYPCLSLHGGMDQFDRDSTITDFKNGNIKIMVATSVAARGLDVKQLNLVVNYDCPNHFEDYVHRVGRTGRAGNKGVAFTLITPDEGKLAQDIIKALETSKGAPPEALKTLWQEYKEQMKAEGKKVKREKNKGFGGKGFKFDEEEEAKSNEMKKMQKWALGLQDSDDEAEAAENAMDKIEDDLNKAFHDSKPKKAPPQLAPGLAGQQPAVIDQDKMKKASSIAAKINIKISQGQNADKTQHAATQILKGGALEQIKGIGLAKQLADKVNAKLNYKAPETEKEEEGQTEPEKLEKYESEIDINDLPQQARWRITSKETISRVCEVSEAGITVRGSYVPPGSKVKEGEKRLHLYIESLSERAIQIARAEVRRLLKEELIKFESSTYRPQAGGRYKVV